MTFSAPTGWRAVCLRRFWQTPTVVLHEWNSMVHFAEFEGTPGRRPLTYDEVQKLFDAAVDGRVEQVRRRRHKGATVTLRDAVMLKTAYGFGRRREVCGFDMTALRS